MLLGHAEPLSELATNISSGKGMLEEVEDRI